MYCHIGTWGPAGWTFLHCAAASYPEKPSVEQKQAMHTFIQTFGSVLPCPTCRRHFLQRVGSMASEVLDSRDRLLAWTVEVHNEVNRENGKRTIDTSDVPGILNAKAMQGMNASTSHVDTHKSQDDDFILWLLVILLSVSFALNLGFAWRYFRAYR